LHPLVLVLAAGLGNSGILSFAHRLHGHRRLCLGGADDPGLKAALCWPAGLSVPVAAAGCPTRCAAVSDAAAVITSFALLVVLYTVMTN
jgi:hypothetical protein